MNILDDLGHTPLAYTKEKIIQKLQFQDGVAMVKGGGDRVVSKDNNSLWFRKPIKQEPEYNDKITIKQNVLHIPYKQELFVESC